MQFSGKLVIIAALAVTVLLVSNIIATKPVALFELPFSFIGSQLFVVSAAIICFPIGYIISDVLTEVYGFRVARGVIWLGFLCNLLMVFLFWMGDLIPGAVFWSAEPVVITDDAGNVVANLPSEHAYEAILGATGWILLGLFRRLYHRRVHQRHRDDPAQEQNSGPDAVAAHHNVHRSRAGHRLHPVLYHRFRRLRPLDWG